METYLIIFLALCLAATGTALYRYQRQIHRICRQLSFLKKNDSNMIIMYESGFGGVAELAGLLNDMLDERRKAERSMKQREKLISDTYTNLSHDIRTPLTSLDGYFQLLRQAQTEEERKRYEEIIRERIRSLEELLEELFTFAKLRDTSYELELAPCPLKKLLTELVLSCYGEWSQRGIVPDIDMPDRELFVRGNELAIRRTIQNVLKNALIHGSKEIGIRLVGEEGCAGLTVTNRVEDPGEVDVERVFERFYKADPARSRTSSGLGLSIAKEFVGHMGGEIRAFLEGDLFGIEIRLPLTEPDR